MPNRRVIVVANKWWECDPLMFVLLHDQARPPGLGWPAVLHHPRPRPPQNPLPKEDLNPVPRAVFQLTAINVEIWCISDLLEDFGATSEYQSSSELKMDRLPRIFRGDPAALVIAFGTAGFPATRSLNGSAVAGTRVFMHNCHPDGSNKYSNWTGGPFNKVLDSALPGDIFTAITSVEPPARPGVVDRFLAAPLNPDPTPQFRARYDAVSIGEVNVSNYKEYDQTDAETLKAFEVVEDPAPAVSLETTHGLIRSSSAAPFFFVSGITDAVGFFHQDVDPRSYAQNTTAAHNAGVVLAWMLPKIDSALANKPAGA